MANKKKPGADRRTDVLRMSIRLTRKWAAFVRHCHVDDSVALGRDVEYGEVIEKALALLKKHRESKTAAAGDGDGDLRSGPRAGSGDPRTAQSGDPRIAQAEPAAGDAVAAA